MVAVRKTSAFAIPATNCIQTTTFAFQFAMPAVEAETALRQILALATEVLNLTEKGVACQPVPKAVTLVNALHQRFARVVRDINFKAHHATLFAPEDALMDDVLDRTLVPVTMVGLWTPLEPAVMRDVIDNA